MAVATYDEIGWLCAFWSSVLFLIGYTLIAHWWNRPEGWTVASLDMALILAVLPAALHYILGVNTRDVFFAWYYGSSGLLVAVVTLARLAVIAWVQQHDTPSRKDRSGRSG